MALLHEVEVEPEDEDVADVPLQRVAEGQEDEAPRPQRRGAPAAGGRTADGEGGTEARPAPRRCRQARAVASAGSVDTPSAARQPQRTITAETSGGAIADPRPTAAITKPVRAGPALRGDPARDAPRRGGEGRRLPDAQHEAQRQEHRQRRGDAAGERAAPDEHLQRRGRDPPPGGALEDPPRAPAVGERPAGNHEERVAEEERAEHAPHLRLGQVELLHQEGAGNGDVDAAEVGSRSPWRTAGPPRARSEAPSRAHLLSRSRAHRTLAERRGGALSRRGFCRRAPRCVKRPVALDFSPALTAFDLTLSRAPRCTGAKAFPTTSGGGGEAIDGSRPADAQAVLQSHVLDGGSCRAGRSPGVGARKLWRRRQPDVSERGQRCPPCPPLPGRRARLDDPGHDRRGIGPRRRRDRGPRERPPRGTSSWPTPPRTRSPPSAPSCTHQGCAITGYAGQAFVCPCHGAQFDASGRVLSGPAPSALRQYQAQLAGNVLTISA